MQAYYRITDLPWSLGEEQDARFRKLLRRVLPAVLAFALVIPLMPVTRQALEKEPELPPQLAKLILERQNKPKPVKKVEPPPAPVPVENPRPRAEPVKSASLPDEPRRQARADVSNIGLAAFEDDLRDLRENAATQSISNADGLAGGSDARRVERSMITAASGRSSGGINTDALSRDTGGAGLAGRSTTRVAGRNGGGGGGAGAGAGAGDSDGRLAARSREEIELVFDKNKAAIFALYNRALRKNPLLRGKLVLQLTIAPSGKVTSCEVLSSELSQSDFERKLVQRIKMFNFGAKEVSVMTTTKPIDFFPA